MGSDYMIGIVVSSDIYERLKAVYFPSSEVSYEMYIHTGEDIQPVIPKHPNIRLSSDSHGSLYYGIFLQTTYNAITEPQDIDSMLIEISESRLLMTQYLNQIGLSTDMLKLVCVNI